MNKGVFADLSGPQPLRTARAPLYDKGFRS